MYMYVQTRKYTSVDKVQTAIGDASMAKKNKWDSLNIRRRNEQLSRRGEAIVTTIDFDSA
jgi:hypothetical protein